MLKGTSLPKIFVSIASYRDPDCQNTIRDLFEKATYPDRIFIGVCWQFRASEDQDCFVLITRPEQVRVIEFDASESLGACWARHQVQKLWQGEDYYFQIDSHMRFVAGWDERLIMMLASCPSQKPVLSTYPLAFTPPNDLAKDDIVSIRARAFDEVGVLGQASILTSIDEAPALPVVSSFIGGGLIFASAKIIEEVPYDPNLYFEGEEITLAVRLWTSGWDIFTPNNVIAYHDYGQRPQRPRHWEDNVDWGQLNHCSQKRVRHLLQTQISVDEHVLRDIERYGLGAVRTLSEYETHSGLDFKARMFKGQPILNSSAKADSEGQCKARVEVFSSIWKDNFWGDQETRSGDGSSLATTSGLREELPKLFEFLNIRILADGGCGDVNWMQELTGKLQLYLGYDIVPELIADLRQRFRTRANCFFSIADMVVDALPEVDAILCRDSLTHLPLDGALMALRLMRQSNSTYFLATTHRVGRNTYVNNGGWYTMDLTAAPFNLPPPSLMIAEGGTKTLGVWRISDLPE